MSSPLPVAAGFAAPAPRRVEVYVLAPDGDGVLLRPGPDGVTRVPGVVLSHGETPREAAVRALDGAIAAPTALVLRQVLSDVRPVAGRPPEAGVHVLRLVLAAVGPQAVDQVAVDPAAVDPALFRSPAPAVTGPPPPGGPPRVQRPAAYAVVVQDGRALLSRVTGYGVWTLPGGGIDHGEHPDDAVRRETFEETGLDLAAFRLVDVDSRHFTGRSPAQVVEDFHGVRILYSGTVAQVREPQVQEVGGSTDAAAWFPLERLDHLRLTDIARTSLRARPRG